MRGLRGAEASPAQISTYSAYWLLDVAAMLLAQHGRIVARGFARIGTLPEPKILDRDARRLAHDVDEHGHLVERAQILLVAPLRLGGRIVERVDAVRARCNGNTAVSA